MPMYRALQPFPFGKNRMMVGEAFEAPEKIGNVLVKIGRAEAAKLEMPEAVQTMKAPARREPKEVEPKAHAPLYQTRHMEAEKPKAESKPKAARPRGRAKKSQS